jgi:cellulose synthase/poly-beta-1,6-N-acetylglucosamine synthase-like glycosyltransferase
MPVTLTGAVVEIGGRSGHAMSAAVARIGDIVRRAVGPAFVEEERDLTSDGLTKPGYVMSLGDSGPGRIVVVIPAHDEAVLIGEALESLAAQTRVPDEVIVVADRCTDLTEQIARAHSATTRITLQNLDNKAGALNQTLAYLLPRLSDNDAVLMMDADTTLSRTFISEAAWRLREPRGRRAQVGAVGGVFFGFPVKGVIAQMQNNEYVRYAREIGRRKGRADVLTGTATLFSAKALRDVDRARSSGELPPGTGIYGVDALTEDNELTLALKHLGYLGVSPKACTCGTELMPTTARLFHQRLRWQRGALQNLLAYGLTRQTAPYVGRQLMTYAAVAFLPFFVTALVHALVTTGSVELSWFWVFVTLFVAFERVWSVKRGGWRSLVLAALVLPEIVYDLLLHVVYIKALADVVTHTRATWDKGSSADRPLRNRITETGFVASLLLAVVALALVCIWLGVAWLTIGGLVLAGAALAALRLSGLDPFGLLLGTGEPAATDHVSAPSTPQGFGGRDVPVPAMATFGGEGTHHCLSGGPGTRNPGATFSAAARRSRQTTTAWLKESRRAQRAGLAAGGRLGTAP